MMYQGSRRPAFLEIGQMYWSCVGKRTARRGRWGPSCSRKTTKASSSSRGSGHTIPAASRECRPRARGLASTASSGTSAAARSRMMSSPLAQETCSTSAGWRCSAAFRNLSKRMVVLSGRRAQDLLVDAQREPGVAFPAEGERGRLAGFAHGGRGHGVVEHPRDDTRERTGVANRRKVAAHPVFDEILGAFALSGDDRRVLGHRFGVHEAERLVRACLLYTSPS